MKFCTKCGAQVDDSVAFCPSCGTAVTGAAPQENAGGNPFTNTADTTAEYDREDINQNRFMAILAYLGPLWFIPFFAKKGSKFAQFHCKQGILVFALYVTYTVLSVLLSLIKVPTYVGYFVTYYSTPWWITVPLSLIGLGITAFAVFGIINAARGLARELPLIGKFRIIK